MSASWRPRMIAVQWVMSAAGTVWCALVVFLDMVCTFVSELMRNADWLRPGGTGGVAESTPRAAALEANFAASGSEHRTGEIRRSRAGAAKVSASEPERRTGEREKRRGLTPTGPGRSHWAGADG